MSKKIGIIGLGYVGYPLSCLFAQKFNVIGFDIDVQKIQLLNLGIDPTGLSDPISLNSLSFSNDVNSLSNCDFLIVTIPTDIDAQNKPNLGPLKLATNMIATILQKDMTVVFESTVYPGLTEEICIPILEQKSGLKWKIDFNVGYSPERINPGEKERPISSIKKIVSGDTLETTERLAELYGCVIQAGVYKAPSIKVAEAAKVIENAQRDLNIAFVNELALIFDRMGIDTRAVLEAAGTKWNFLSFEPGLVGGQCIGVDPYYLTYKSEALGYTPRVIHSGRVVNNEMGKFIAEKVVKTLIHQKKSVSNSRVLILGCAFKENIGDARNSKIFDICHELMSYSVKVDILDPLVVNTQFKHLDFPILENLNEKIKYDAIILAVKHQIFKDISLDKLISISIKGHLNLFDVKAFYNFEDAQTASKVYWRL
jgi:UDP-N-acetyl-D-galactosamine dehydrogenase